MHPSACKLAPDIVAQAEETDLMGGHHGNWTIENAKSRLHQYLQMNRIRTDYKYQAIGPDHNRYVRRVFLYRFVPACPGFVG